MMHDAVRHTPMLQHSQRLGELVPGVVMLCSYQISTTPVPGPRSCSDWAYRSVLYTVLNYCIVKVRISLRRPTGTDPFRVLKVFRSLSACREL